MWRKPFVMPFSGINVTRGNMHGKLDEKGVIITSMFCRNQRCLSHEVLQLLCFSLISHGDIPFLHSKHSKNVFSLVKAEFDTGCFALYFT